MEQKATQGDSGGDRSPAEEMAKRIWEEIQTNRMVPTEPSKPNKEKQKEK